MASCPYCNSMELRNSRFRFIDLAQSLLLRLPVRCRDCNLRAHVFLPQALRIHRDSRIRQQEHQHRKSADAEAER